MKYCIEASCCIYIAFKHNLFSHQCNYFHFSFSSSRHFSAQTAIIRCLKARYRLRAAAVRARQTRSFVYELITVFLSSIEARAAVDRFSILSRKKRRKVTRPSQLKEHSALKSLCRGTKNRSDLARHASSSREAMFVRPRPATWYRLCEAKQRTLPPAAAAHNR
jgi:hypothetical protein